MARRQPHEPPDEDSRRVRVILQNAAAHDATPRRDLVRGAVRRLTARRRSITSVNEFFGALRAIMRGFVTLMSVEESASDARPHANPAPDGTSHG